MITCPKQVKRVAIAIAGGFVLVLGIVMLALPGPAVIVIPCGLAILALEFTWAKRWLRSVRAVLPRRKLNQSWQKLTPGSVRRGAEFLWRQFRRTLSPKQKARPIDLARCCHKNNPAMG